MTGTGTIITVGFGVTSSIELSSLGDGNISPNAGPKMTEPPTAEGDGVDFIGDGVVGIGGGGFGSLGAHSFDQMAVSAQ